MLDTTRFAWAEDVDAISLTMVRGLAAEAAIAQLRLRPLDDSHPRTFAAAWQTHRPERFDWFVQLDRLGDWLVIIEDNGFLGCLPEYLGALSADGEAVNLYWNVNFNTKFGYARAGSVVRAFDPRGINGEDGEPLAVEADIDFADEDADTAGLMLLLMERITGETPDVDWLMQRARPIYLANTSAA